MQETLAGTTDGLERAALAAMARSPTAFWVDSKSKILGHAGLGALDTVEGVLRNASASRSLVVLMIYNLPNRDCNAKASNGEICCARSSDGSCDYSGAAGRSCAPGLREYKDFYITPLADVLGRFHARLPIVVIIEPDSLGNVVTNLGQGGCSPSTVNAYKEGITFAVTAIARAAPTVAMYVDAGHGGWLGFVRTCGGSTPPRVV